MTLKPQPFFLKLILISLVTLSTQVFAKTEPLRSDWQIQDSTVVNAPMAVISTENFATRDWINTSVPNTVLGAIVQSGQVNFNPFFVTNLKNLPGSGPYYEWGKNFGTILTPTDSPFGHPWIYRKQFNLSRKRADNFYDLTFKGLTYSADVWLNGVQVAKKEDVRGSYREFKLDITKLLKAGNNVLAVSISPPTPTDLTPNWVDWNHTPQDKNMGIWNQVFVTEHGAIALSHPQVVTHLEGTKALLTVEVEAKNYSSSNETTKISASLLSQTLSKRIVLKPGETMTVKFLPSEHKSLTLDNPKLWWPYQMGEPTLHTLKITADDEGRLSDQQSLKFGIREITSELNSSESRLFKINGKPILIRGGGWASDMFLRFSATRLQQEFKYIKDLGLNTIRLEGRFETDDFSNLADQEGVLVMTGWVCCSYWQESKSWTAADLQLATDSLRDQVYNFRAHASTLAFLYGSDDAPVEAAENNYYKVFESYDWPNPIISSASATTTALNGPSGFKMSGPYDYTPPSYWSIDKKYGGAFGFNTETSPGAAIPPIESLKEFLPADHLWPIDDVWKFHAGVLDFAQIDKYQEGLIRRYGAPSGVEDFALKSQALDYENHRAMFEAFAKAKYQPATGIIQWMLNNAWPSLIWHLYDYYLRPGGAYFGAKKANSLLHLIYGYDDNSINIANHTQQSYSGLNYSAEAFDLNSKSIFKVSGQTDIASDTSKLLKLLPDAQLPKTYFLRLILSDSQNKVIDNNFYWLSSQKEIFDWANWHYTSTPVLQDADLTALASLPAASVHVSPHKTRNERGSFEIKNTSTTLAFLLHYKLMNATEELLPVLWSDNYISLLPGETREIDFDYSLANQTKNSLHVEVDGWNVVNSSLSLQ